ncbi:MAG: hypothetical protein ABSE08_15315 [Syntrophobacteraceae bacterium]|jgi:hypothetical protein
MRLLVVKQYPDSHFNASVQFLQQRAISLRVYLKESNDLSFFGKYAPEAHGDYCCLAMEIIDDPLIRHDGVKISRGELRS